MRVQVFNQKEERSPEKHDHDHCLGIFPHGEVEQGKIDQDNIVQRDVETSRHQDGKHDQETEQVDPEKLQNFADSVVLVPVFRA